MATKAAREKYVYSEEAKNGDACAHQIEIDPVPSHIKKSHSDVAHYDPAVGRLGRGSGGGLAKERYRHVGHGPLQWLDAGLVEGRRVG